MKTSINLHLTDETQFEVHTWEKGAFVVMRDGEFGSDVTIFVHPNFMGVLDEFIRCVQQARSEQFARMTDEQFAEYRAQQAARYSALLKHDED